MYTILLLISHVPFAAVFPLSMIPSLYPLFSTLILSWIWLFLITPFTMHPWPPGPIFTYIAVELAWLILATLTLTVDSLLFSIRLPVDEAVGSTRIAKAL